MDDSLTFGAGGPDTKGYSLNRLNPLADNPREVAFAEAWHKVNSRLGSTPTIYHLLPAGGTDAQHKAAATVIQWLGSNVGMGFLDDVIQSNPEVRKFLLHSCLSAKMREEDLAKSSTPELRAKNFDVDKALTPMWGEGGASTTEAVWSGPALGDAPITVTDAADREWEIIQEGVARNDLPMDDGRRNRPW